MAEINTDADKTRTEAITLEEKIYAKGKRDTVNQILTTFFVESKKEQND